MIALEVEQIAELLEDVKDDTAAFFYSMKTVRDLRLQLAAAEERHKIARLQLDDTKRKLHELIEAQP